MSVLSAVVRLEKRRQRLDRALAAIPYFAVTASVVLVLVVGDEVPHQPYPLALSLAAVTTAWIAYWITLHPRWNVDVRRMAIFFAGFVVLIYALVWCSPLFGFTAWTGFLFTTALPGWWRYLGGTLVGTATATAQVGGFGVITDLGTWIFMALLLIFNAGIANAMIYLTTSNFDQSERRARTIDDLAEANAKLEAALQENAGLHAQLLVQAREAGVLDERQRMAGEIHDVLAQGLTGIVTQLEAADAAADRPADRRRHLNTAKQLARDGLTEARRSVQALRPQPLDSAALPEAIGEVVADWSRISGVRADLITTGAARPLLPVIETTLLRAAQEALANVAKHAAAGRVTLTLSYMEDLVTLDVHDDGAGFDPDDEREPSADGGYGLAAMRERLSRIAGTLAVESEPGGGTALSACVPAIPIGAAA